MRATGLSLSLPEINQAIRTEVITRPDEAKRWLASLPFLNVNETGRLIFSSLKDLNRLPLDDDQRLKLMELYRQPVSTITRELQKHYLDLPVPIPLKNRPIAEQVQQFQIEMAHGYLRVAQHAAQKPALNRTDQQTVALAIQRGVRYLTELLAKSYEVYAPCPAGCWREIHQLFRCAERLGVTETEVPDPLNASVKHSSVAHVYKQALLLAFSNPYRLPPRILGKVLHYLDHWASYAKIAQPGQELQRNCQFLINLQEDRAGISDTEGVVISHDVPYRLLTTHDLARVLHSQYTILRHGKTPPSEGLEPDFFGPESLDILRCLIDAWGIKPRRVFTRIPRYDAQFEVAMGVDNGNFFINGQQEFQPSTTEVGPLRKPKANAMPRAQVQGKSQPARTLTNWRLVDESASGIALRKAAGGVDQVRVGELVVLRQTGKTANRNWNLAVVRWIKNAENDEIEMGIQRLAPQAEARAIRTDTLHDLDSGLIPALFLPGIDSMKQPATLVTRRGIYRPDRIMTVDDGYRAQRASATRLVQVNPSFEQFEFRLLDS